MQRRAYFVVLPDFSEELWTRKPVLPSEETMSGGLFDALGTRNQVH